MAYQKITTGEIRTDEEGKKTFYTEHIAGKIVKVRVDYGDAEPFTSIKILTLEHEKVIELKENNKDEILYPRHSVINERFPQIPIKEGEPMMDYFVSVGPIIIEIENAGEQKTIKNIIITYEE